MTTPLFQIPKPIMENMEKLNELVEKYPLDIPVPEAAKLMGMKPECLRAAIDCGTFELPKMQGKDLFYKTMKGDLILIYDRAKKELIIQTEKNIILKGLEKIQLEGKQIILKAADQVQVQANAVQIEAANISLTGQLSVNGQTSISGETSINGNLSVSGVVSAQNI